GRLATSARSWSRRAGGGYWGGGCGSRASGRCSSTLLRPTLGSWWSRSDPALAASRPNPALQRTAAAMRDHDRARLFKEYGLFLIEFYDASRCYNSPEEVVGDFLQRLGRV